MIYSSLFFFSWHSNGVNLKKGTYKLSLVVTFVTVDDEYVMNNTSLFTV